MSVAITNQKHYENIEKFSISCGFPETTPIDNDSAFRSTESTNFSKVSYNSNSRATVNTYWNRIGREINSNLETIIIG